MTRRETLNPLEPLPSGMSTSSLPVAQAELPGFLPDLVGLAGAVVIVLMLVAMAAFAYRSMNGGVEWPEDREQDGDALRHGDPDDEWDYY